MCLGTSFSRRAHTRYVHQLLRLSSVQHLRKLQTVLATELLTVCCTRCLRQSWLQRRPCTCTSCCCMSFRWSLRQAKDAIGQTAQLCHPQELSAPWLLRLLISDSLPQVFAGDLAGGGKAVAFLNRHSFQTQYPLSNITVTWAQLGWVEDQLVSVRDLWARSDLPQAAGSCTVQVDVHDTRLLRLQPASAAVTHASVDTQPLGSVSRTS